MLEKLVLKGQRERCKRKGNPREAYYILTKIDLPKPFEGNLSLCHLCKYALWQGDCCDADLDCQHRLYVVSERSYDVWDGADCWGFRPKYRCDDAVDIIGIYLTGRNPNFEKLEELDARK